MPKCLWDLTSWICTFCIKSGGCCQVFNFRGSKSASVLDGLKITSHVEAHRVILPKSEFKQEAALGGLSTMIKRLVSSANNRMLDPMSLSMSFIKRRKSKDPRIDP